MIIYGYLILSVQVQLSKQSSISDHCRAYALSDPKDKDYQMTCPRDHLETCDRCELLASVLTDVHDALEKSWPLWKVKLSKTSWHGKHTYSDVLIRMKLTRGD